MLKLVKVIYSSVKRSDLEAYMIVCSFTNRHAEIVKTRFEMEMKQWGVTKVDSVEILGMGEGDMIRVDFND